VVFEVVGVLPDIDAVNEFSALHQRGVLVGVGLDKELSVLATSEPGPTAAKDAHGALGHFLLPLFITSKSIVDLLGQFALWLLAGVGKGLPEVGVVGVSAGVVAHGGADLGGHSIQVV